MKIKWIHGTRIVTGLGVIKEGDVREVETITGKNLIKQGLAVLYINKPKKQKREVK